MSARQQITKKRLADLNLRETSMGQYQYIGPKENNKPKNNKTIKEST